MLWKTSRQKLLTRKRSTGKDRKTSNTMRLRIDPMDWTVQWKPKRKVLGIAKNLTRLRNKRKIRDVNERTDTVDRISELPEPVIHHILSFIRCPRDATRTSILSKKWRSIWASFLTFDFDQNSFKAQGEVGEAFKSFVESSLSTRIAPLVCIHKFRLHVTSFDSKLARNMDLWLHAAAAKNLKELEVYVETKKGKCYTLPQDVLAAKTLTSLKLYGCKFDNYDDIKLPNLLQLSIKKARINANSILSFIRSCPLIEDLRLIYCNGLDRLHISTLNKLNRVEVHECQGLTWVEIEAPSLQTFWFCGESSVICHFNLQCCKSLESLTWKEIYMTDEMFQAQISNFPVLQTLVLKECHYLRTPTFLSPKLKRLALIRRKSISEVIIDAPNLHSFEFTGERTVLLSMETPELQEAKLYFELMRKGTSKEHSGGDLLRWLKLEEFLGKFNQSKRLKLVGRYNKATHPETLSVVSPCKSELLKLLHEKLMNREENPSCCRYYSRKCWRHYLKDVKIGSKGTHFCPWNPTPHRATIKLEWTDG